MGLGAGAAVGRCDAVRGLTASSHRARGWLREEAPPRCIFASAHLQYSCSLGGHSATGM